MDSVYVMDNRGSEKLATKVRYFKYNNNCYFVYTLNEIDNEGYVKLYIKKIVGTEDVGIDDSEWPTVKGIVQEVFREIKAGTHYSYEDLDLNKVSEIMDTGARIFRLKKIVVDDILAKKADGSLEDVSTKLISGLKEDIESNNEKNDNEELINDKQDNQIAEGGLNSSLLNLLKRVEEVSKEEDLFNSPGSLKLDDEIETKTFEPNIGIDSTRNFDYLEPSITEKVVENNIDNDIKSKLRPLVVGNLPIIEYKEKIEKLENEIKTYQDQFFNLKRDFEQLKNENIKLKDQIEKSGEIVSKYENKINHLKDVIKDI